MFSGCASVCLSTESLLVQYFRNCFREFRQVYSTGAFEDTHEHRLYFEVKRSSWPEHSWWKGRINIDGLPLSTVWSSSNF